MPDGWQAWREWHRTICPENHREIKALEADRGKYLGYVRAVGRRRPGIFLEEPIASFPSSYKEEPLLRSKIDKAAGR